MVLKRSKSHKKHARQAALQASVAESPSYCPPPREGLEAEEWAEIQDGWYFQVRAWYFRKKGQSGARKLADFHIQAFWTRQDNQGVGRLVASADCLNHGTFHFHDELSDLDHSTRQDFLPLFSPADVEMAFVQACDRLEVFAARIISREGRKP